MTNPWMSLWLSAANRWAGLARGLWMAEMRRQQALLMREATREMVRFWSGAWLLPAPDGKRRRRR